MALLAATVIDALFEDIQRRASECVDPTTAGSNSGLKVPERPFLNLSADHLLKLKLFFDKNLERALEILDIGGVLKLSAEPSGRAVFKVQGNLRGGEQYVCFPSHYCACPAFFYEVVSRSEQLLCKHQLAARLSQVLQCCPEVKVSDATLAKFLLGCKHLATDYSISATRQT